MRVIICLITIVSACAAFAATQAAARTSQCKNIRTVQQAAKAGELPAIVAALHGGAPIANRLLTCNARSL